MVVAAGGDDDGGDEVERADVQRGLDRLAGRRLKTEVRDAADGIAARVPAGWTKRAQRGVVTVESPDRCVLVSLDAPADADQAGGVLDDAVAALRDASPEATVRRQGIPQERVAGLPTESAVVEIPREGSDPVRVLILVTEGERLAYLTQVVSRNPACGKSLVDSQLVVDSIELSK